MDSAAPRDELQQTALPRGGRSGLAAWIGLGVIALLFLSYLKWRPLPIGADGINHPVVGQKLEFLQFEPLTGEGETVTAADLAGKVTLINVWGTWCPPCVEEFPYLAAIYEQFKSRAEFQYLSVSYDDKAVGELRQSTGDFLHRMRVDHPTYHDPGAATLVALRGLGVEDAFPTTMVIDTEGTIRGVWRGYSRSAIADVERLLRELLDE
jgi:thiol-disulfide isomerase/thioredoxin